MYERSYGTNYDGKLSTKEIAAKIREEIKRLVKAGKLPADWKYSTRYESFSMGSAIRMTATSPRPVYLMEPGQVWAPRDEDVVVRVPSQKRYREEEGGELWMNLRLRAGDQYIVSRTDAETDEAAQVREILTELHGSYNHNGSDIMTDYFDVNYYGQVEITTAGGWANEYQEKLPRYVAV